MFSRAVSKASKRVLYSNKTREIHHYHCCYTQNAFINNHNNPQPLNLQQALTINKPLSPLNTTWKSNLPRIKDNIAIIQDNHQITFGELDFKAKQLYFKLKYEYALEKGDVLAHITSLRPDDTMVMLAASLLGLKYAPILPTYTNKINEITKMINARLIITEPNYYQYVHNDINKIILSNEYDPDSYIADGTFIYDDIEDMADHDDTLYIAFTSGTTGVPKGCLYSHETMMNNLYGKSKYKDDPGSGSRLMYQGMNVVAIMQRWASLLNGQPMIYTNKHKCMDPEHWHELCEDNNITDAFLFGRAMADMCSMNQRFDSLKYIIFGGDFVPFKTVKYLKENLLSTDCKLVNGYGMTELGWISQLAPEKLDEIISADVNKQLPAGSALDDSIEIKVEDGEIMVKKTTDSRMTEYLNNPEKTAELFQSDKNGDKWAKTGDTGYIDDNGDIVLQGRQKDVIVSSLGRNISPVDIETVISSHKDVKEVAVIGSPNTLRDERLSGEVPVAFVSLRMDLIEYVDERNRISGELMDLCKRLLSKESQIEEIYFVMDLPKTASKKMDKNALRAALSDRNVVIVGMNPMQNSVSK